MAHRCYCDILRAASRRMTALYDDALAPVGLNLAQFSLMRKIRRSEPVSLTDLGRITELDRSTVGRNVKVLERMGLTRAVAGRDQREAAITLTEAGLHRLDSAAPLWDAVQARIEASLGPDGTEKLEALLSGV